MTVEELKREQMKKELCRLVDEGWISYEKEEDGMSIIKIERAISAWETPFFHKWSVAFRS